MGEQREEEGGREMDDTKDEALALIDSMNPVWGKLYDLLKGSGEMLLQMHDADDRANVSKFVSDVFNVAMAMNTLTADYYQKHKKAVPHEIL